VAAEAVEVAAVLAQPEAAAEVEPSRQVEEEVAAEAEPSRQVEEEAAAEAEPSRQVEEVAAEAEPSRQVATNPEVRRVAGPSRQVEAPEAYLAAALRWPDLQVAPFGIPEADRQAGVRKVLTRSEAEQRREVQAAGPGIPDVHPAAAQ
jgi:DNA replication initiation complex subunit (GINS family)